jgi:hypothetical protein
MVNRSAFTFFSSACTNPDPEGCISSCACRAFLSVPVERLHPVVRKE